MNLIMNFNLEPLYNYPENYYFHSFDGAANAAWMSTMKIKNFKNRKMTILKKTLLNH